MPKCAVKKCKNYTLKVQKKDGVSYFHFPRNEVQREKWRRIIARVNEDEFYKPNASSVICSEHFDENCIYLTQKRFKRILKTAIPNIKPVESRLVDGQNTSSDLVSKNLEAPSTSSNPNSNVTQTKTSKFEENNTPLPANECAGVFIPIEVAESGGIQVKAHSIANSPSTSLSLGSLLDTPHKATLRKESDHVKRNYWIKL